MKVNQESSNEELFNPEMLGTYYSRIFPYELLHSWISYDPYTTNNSLFSRREFSFTISNSEGNEAYIRYKSFAKENEMRNAILKARPVKIDIGAVYNHPPKNKDSIGNFQTVQRELVFDIDLTDYDSVRKCGCQEANICSKCWKLMTMAIKVMNRGLSEDFGFQHIAWFYSGRRGVHAWICDTNARFLTNEARSAIASYFEITVATENNKDAYPLSMPLHPLITRSYDILEPFFIEDILSSSGFGLLSDSESWNSLLCTIPECAEKVKEKLLEDWEISPSSSSEKWYQLLKMLDIFLKANKKVPNTKQAKFLSTAEINKVETWKYKTVFTYTYPRLDINVSKMQNHLLKSPFCVHPKTGRVCVPIDTTKVEDFDPFSVPTLPGLIKELDEYSCSTKNKEMENVVNEAGKQEWHKTSLKTSFEYFRKSILAPLLKELKREERETRERYAASMNDF